MILQAANEYLEDATRGLRVLPLRLTRRRRELLSGVGRDNRLSFGMRGPMFIGTAPLKSLLASTVFF